jgi:hypothetical protein
MKTIATVRDMGNSGILAAGKQVLHTFGNQRTQRNLKRQ